MTPLLWLMAILAVFVVSLIGQIIRGRRNPWIVPIVVTVLLALAVVTLTKVVVPKLHNAVTKTIRGS